MWQIPPNPAMVTWRMASAKSKGLYNNKTDLVKEYVQDLVHFIMIMCVKYPFEIF